VNFCTLGGKVVVDAPKGWRQSNWFEMGVGSAPGEGRFLIRRDDWASLAGQANPKLFMQNDADPSTRKIEMPVKVIGYTPYSSTTGVSVGNDADILEVLVYDRRYQLHYYDPGASAINVQKPWFKHNSSNVPQFYADTLTGLVEYTWAGLLAGVTLAPGLSVPTTFKPRNFVSDWENRGEVLQRIADFLCFVLAFDWEGSDYIMCGNTQMLTANNTHLTYALANTLVWKESVFNNNNLPGKYKFVFRSDGDPYDATRHIEIDQNTGVGDSLLEKAVHIGYYLAHMDEGTNTNLAELTAIAEYMTPLMTTLMLQNPNELIVPTILPMIPDGKVRRIAWINDAFGLRTVIRLFDDRPIVSREDCRGGLANVGAYSDAIAERTVDKRVMVIGGPTDWNNVVVPALITAVSGSGRAATYSAEAVPPATLTVSGATPVNRPFEPLEIVEASVGDPCFLARFNEESLTPSLIQLTEVLEPGDCEGNVVTLRLLSMSMTSDDMFRPTDDFFEDLMTGVVINGGYFSGRTNR
jgi:hypothetical protein